MSAHWLTGTAGVPTFHSLLVSHKPVWGRSSLTTLDMIVVWWWGGEGGREEGWTPGVFVLQIIDILALY